MTPERHRSEITVDLAAVRSNVRTLRRAIGPTALWAVVKADGYGHGAVPVGRAAVEEGAAALCVATVGEGLALRAALPGPRVVVLGPWLDDDLPAAREGRLELVAVDGRIPEGIPVHVKLDTGMGRWGSDALGELPANVVGLMSHLATADTDVAFAEYQLGRFLELTSSLPDLPRTIANSAGALGLPAARLDACRTGIALYGLSPFGTDPAADGLAPALAWRSHLARVRCVQPGESTGYGRRFVAESPTWIGVVPVGYADGFRRDLTGTSVLVAGERRPVVGTVSMDAFAVALDRELPVGAPVTIVGDGLLLEEHAAHAGTITYELATGLSAAPAARCRRTLLG